MNPTTASQLTPAPTSTRRRKLLPAGALSGRAVALSVSDSEDLGALGLLQTHLQLALAEIARVVYVSGGRMLYGGDLRPGGHTDLLLQELSRYGRVRGSLSLCLAWSVHRRSALAALDATDARLGLRGEIIALDPDGHALADWRGGRPAEGVDDLSAAQKEMAFAAMRAFVCARENARVAIGGRRQGGNTMPGVLQEVLLSLAQQHPVFLAGGFGGSTLDIAAAIDPACRALKAPTAGAVAPRAQTVLAELARQAAAPGSGGGDVSGWRLLNNGLDDEENRRLAATHRPSEIAALVATGLGRVAMA
jgi:hypothetical protein